MSAVAEQRQKTSEAVRLLEGALAAWRDSVSTDTSLTDAHLAAAEVLVKAFRCTLKWIELTPGRCAEMGIWFGGGAVDDLALELPDVVALAELKDGSAAAGLLRAVHDFDRRGWLRIEDWRVRLCDRAVATAGR